MGFKPTRNGVTACALATLAAALWFLANPYIGIDHDARLYTLMAMRWLAPAAYARDPWFAAGTQDDWSVYSPIYAQVLLWLGPEQGARAMTLLGAGMFLYGAWRLAGAALRGPAVWLAFLLLVSVPINYSTRDMLKVSEAFATARMLAVPLSMLAVAAVLRGHRLVAIIWHLAAMLLHPAMGLAALLVSTMLAVGARRWLSLSLLGTVVVVAVLLAGIAGYLPMIDGAWLAFVEPAPLVFIHSWVEANPWELLAPFFLLLMVGRCGQYRARTLYLVTALIGAGGVLLSLVAGDHAPVAVIMQAQFWRALWLVKIIATIAIVDFAAAYLLRRHGPNSTYRVLCAVLASSMAVGVPPVLVFAAAWLSLVLLPEAISRQAALWLQRWRYWLWLLAAGIIAMAIPKYLMHLSLAATGLNYPTWFPDVVVGLLRTGGYGLIALVCWWMAQRARHTIFLSIAFTAVLVALALWDERSPLQRHWESYFRIDGSQRHFSQWIARGQTVYWHAAAPRVWFELGTAGYASATHATGMVFSRARTHMLESRMLNVAKRGLSEVQYRQASSLTSLLNLAHGNANGIGPANMFVLVQYETRSATTPFGVFALCADPALDFVIESLEIPGAALAMEIEVVAGRRTPLYLYRCQDLRARRQNM